MIVFFVDSYICYFNVYWIDIYKRKWLFLPKTTYIRRISKYLNLNIAGWLDVVNFQFFFLSPSLIIVKLCFHIVIFTFVHAKPMSEKFICYSSVIFRLIKWAMHNSQAFFLLRYGIFAWILMFFLFISSFSILGFKFSSADVRNLFLCSGKIHWNCQSLTMSRFVVAALLHSNLSFYSFVLYFYRLSLSAFGLRRLINRMPLYFVMLLHSNAHSFQQIPILYCCCFI